MLNEFFLPQGVISPEWTTITSDDEMLYSSFFARTEDPFLYENNWAFFSQEARFGGIKYVRNDVLLTGVIRHPASLYLFLFPPLGSIESYLKHIPTIAATLSSKTKKRIVLRKLPPYLVDGVLTSGPFTLLSPDVFVHPRDVPEDVYPQAIIDVAATRRCAAGNFMKVRNHLVRFRNNAPISKTLTPELVPDVVTLIRAWNDLYYRRHTCNSSTPADASVDNSAYSVFAETFASRIDQNKYFSRLIYVGGDAVGFAFAGRISTRAAALYSSISLTNYRGSSEYLLMDLFDQLADTGIEFVNMGGSETRGLFEFKSKFATRELRQCYDMEYTPSETK